MADRLVLFCALWTFILIISVFSCNGTRLKSGSTAAPRSGFSKHVIIKPKFFHGREKREISSSRENDGHIHDISVGFNLDGEDVIVDLQLNRDLIPRNYFEKYQHRGKHVINKPTGKEVDHCHYQGWLRNSPQSWAAISTCDGISGVIFDGKELHYIEKIPDVNTENLHYLYSQRNLDLPDLKCGYEGTPHTVYENETFNRILRYKRESTDMIHGPYNANRLSRYVELVLVVDHRKFEENGRDKEKVFNRCKQIANIVNALYTQLNIFVSLVGAVVWTEDDEITLSPNPDQTLTSFLSYRRDRLVQEHPNDNAQLLTGIQFEGGVVGKALKGPICTYEYSGGVNMDYSPVVGLVATTVAHELGHSFGMEHDDMDECICPVEKCIMAPSASSSAVSPTQWSFCSLEYLALAFGHGMDYCLRNKPVSLFGGPVCGNGFVEPGEQCDCGLPDHCDNSCCNATSCMLYQNATCATGECCNLETCRPHEAGLECRSAEHECDLSEFCTGSSEYCPKDVFRMDGTKCNMGKAYCYSGSCRTHSDQCKLLWGYSGKSSDLQCYKKNTKGDQNGNCGFSLIGKQYRKCRNEDVLCGMLHCAHLNERLEFGMESVAKLSHSFINTNGKIIACRSAIIDLGLNEIDPGLVPDGAKCGQGKMCVNQRCMPVAALTIIKQNNCTNNCFGNGVCNSNGNCHCDVGFAPPYCNAPGPGGSVESGPAKNPNVTNHFGIAMYIIFLGIVPLIVIIVVIVYYLRGNLQCWWKKKSVYVDQPPVDSSWMHDMCNKMWRTFCMTKRHRAVDDYIMGRSVPPAAQATKVGTGDKNSERQTFRFLAKNQKSSPSLNLNSKLSDGHLKFEKGPVCVSDVFAKVKILKEKCLITV